MKGLVDLSRRKIFTSLTLIVFGFILPRRPLANVRKTVDEIIEQNSLREGITATLFDFKKNEILESHNKELKLPLASVAKAVTAVYGIETIGEEHKFTTDLFTDGVVKNGILEGNIYLIGGGDPSLSTDDLRNFVEAVKKLGIRGISGNFFYNSEIIPEFLAIDPSQLPQASYNPGFSGLNLNNNKVLFSWTKDGRDYDLRIEARSLKSSVPMNNISIQGKRQLDKVFEYVLEPKTRVEKWTVLRKVLGKKGVRWLPVRLASSYVSSVLHYLFIESNIDIPLPIKSKKEEISLELLFRHRSKDLPSLTKEMLYSSSNVTAEIIGLFAANFWGMFTPQISSSGIIMSKWFNFVSQTDGNMFINHSGLTSESRVSSLDFVKFLIRKETKEVLIPLLKEQKIYGSEKKKIYGAGIKVVAKTGTMHFNRGLAGYIIKNNIPLAVFAIFSADIKEKKSIKKDQLSNPPGSKNWLLQARSAENNILANWAKQYI